MAPTARRIAFVLASTQHGAMILNRFDYRVTAPGRGIGVGMSLLSNSWYEPDEAATIATLLDARRKHFGDGVNVLDIGANIGVFTVEWAKHMAGWGRVLAFEAQERIFHALAGNVALNNCSNARPFWAAVASKPGVIRIPSPDYFVPGSFGSLELRRTDRNEDIGQPIDYSDDKLVDVTSVSIDTLGLTRLDLVKLDVEGMELEVLDGARQTIGRFQPILAIEEIKIDHAALKNFLDGFGYRTYSAGPNVLAIHPDDPTIEMVKEIPPNSE
jgi:FkbM family methyltransferase